MNPLINRELYAELSRLLEALLSDPLGDAQLHLNNLVHQHPPGDIRDCLEQLLGEPGSEKHLFVCSWCIVSFPGSSLVDRAVAALESQLESKSCENRRWAVFYLFYSNATSTAAIPRLHSLMEEADDEQLTLWAAAAIYQIATLPTSHERAAAAAGRRVVDAFKSDDVAIFVAAAIAMGRQAVDRERVAAEIVRRYGIASEGERFALLSCLPKVKVFNASIADLLRTDIFSPYSSDRLRTAAVHALSGMPDDFEVRSLLLEAMESPIWEVSRYALAVLVQRQSVSDELIERLGLMIADDCPEKRRAAVYTLGDLRGHVYSQIGPLVDRLAVELDDSVCVALVETLGHLGNAAIKPLIDALRSSSLRTVPLYQYALLAIGESGVSEFARLLEDENSRVRETAGYILQSLGPKAAVASGQLESYIRTGDKELSIYALMAVARMGIAGRDLAPAAADLLLHRDTEIAWWAEAALFGIGREAIASVEEIAAAGRDFDGRCEHLLQRLLSTTAALPTPIDQGVEGVTNVRHLRLFAVLGRLAVDEGIHSLRAAAARIGAMQCDDEKLDALPASAGSLRLVLSAIEKSLTRTRGNAVKLFARSERHKTGGLTPEGSAFLAKVERYLERLDSAGK